MMFDYRKIQYGTPEYREQRAMRNKYLRVPLGLSLSDEDIAGEDSQHHFGIFADHKLLGSVIVKPLSRDTVKIRQMVIVPDMQACGLGRKLLDFAESYCWQHNFLLIKINARAEAVGFYEKCGYVVCSEAFIDIGIRHYKMAKRG